MASSELHPGVYVNEVPQTAQPITGASTSTAAFVGWVRESDFNYTPVLDRKILRKAQFTTTAPSGGSGTVWLKFPLSKTPAALSAPYSIVGFLNKLQIQIGPYVIPPFETGTKSYGPYGPYGSYGPYGPYSLPQKQLGPYEFGPYFYSTDQIHYGALKSTALPPPVTVTTESGWTVTCALVSNLTNETDSAASYLMIGLQITVTPPIAGETPPVVEKIEQKVQEVKTWIAENPEAAAAIKKLVEKALETVGNAVEAVLKFVLEGIHLYVVGPAAGIDVFYYQDKPPQLLPLPNEIILCTSYDDYRRYFYGTDIPVPGLFELSNAVYGFFDNGGSICYVVRVATPDGVPDALTALEPIDDVSLVAAPMPSNLGQGSDQANKTMRAQVRQWLSEYCERMGNRFAILDGEQQPAELTPAGIYPSAGGSGEGPDSGYAAIYYPWILVGPDAVAVPPSGHIAGVYARTDSSVGVFKAPANANVLGAVGLMQDISKNQQDLLNPGGINCIRRISGNSVVWGARTVGGDENGPYKYISSRRMMIYLEQSIRESTNWAVFEPNSPPLWAKITRNVSDFLYNTWRDGGLFGATPQEAYFVRCDASTNPASTRELGQVKAVVGVALLQPAEFVIFELFQFTA